MTQSDQHVHEESQLRRSKPEIGPLTLLRSRWQEVRAFRRTALNNVPQSVMLLNCVVTMCRKARHEQTSKDP
jgi:hypothetical protein